MDQVKRFLAAFGLILLYMVAWVPPLLIWITLWRGNDAAIAIGLLGALVVMIIGFIPYLNFASKKVFYFAGEGHPVPEEKLRAIIKDVNRLDVPVWVRERGRELIVTWRYVDAKWWEILAHAGLKRVYELHIKFDDRKKEATLIDVEKSVSWRAGPTEVRLYGGFFRGIIFAYEIGKQWGIKENFQLGKVYDYKFTPQEIKTPVMNSILRNGWAVRFGIW
ncbi:MAG TPA: hypothetical protein ENL34_12495 [Chloroflexi bacterium]|nr:hypothetical protein [Chloroflexota bacterium]